MSDKTGLPSGKHTLVEEGTELKGTLTSNCPIVVMGKVEGDISAPMIQVTASGVIAGNVKAKELRSAGEVAGEVNAETVTISGRVRDKTVIRAKSLHVAVDVSTGAMEVVFGECELAIGDEPDKQAAIAAATAPPPEAKPEPAKPEPAKPEPAKPEPAAVDAKPERKPDDEEPAPRRRGTQPPPPT